MARKITNKTKVVKKPAEAKKPKGKVVKAVTVEDVVPEVETKVTSTKSLVDDKLISKALKELTKFVSNKEEKEDDKTQLFEDELVDNLQIIVSKKDLFTSKKNFKPKLIHIQNRPIFETKPSVVLFIRDDVVDKDLLDKIEESELNSLITQIITGTELKTTYKQYEKRRELFSTNDLFLADDGLVTSLPKLLGKTFYDSNKLPIPIKISKEKFSIQSIINQVNKVIGSVVYHVPRSNNLTVNLGKLDQINEGVVSQVINHFQSLDNLRSIFIKTNQSPSLPLYELSTVYTASDIEPEAAKKATVSKLVDIEGLPENIKLSEFERGLIELANPEEIPQLFSNKIKKSLKLTKKENNDKVSKPIKKAKKAKA